MVTEYDVTKALDAHGIDHGDIFHRGARTNIAYSDDSLVFCKVLRSGGSRRLAEVELSLAKEYEGLMGAPLHPELIAVDDSLMSVWAFQSMRTLKPEYTTASEAESAAAALTEIHRLRLPDARIGRMIDFDKFSYNIERRIERGRELGFSTHRIAGLQELTSRFISSQTFTGNPEIVLTHGDTHIGNAASVAGSPGIRWIDFESSKLAPRELDIATLQISLLNIGGNHAAWDSAKSVFEDAGADSELTSQFATIRMISLTSTSLLARSEMSFFEKRMDSMLPLLEGGDAPVIFPRKPSSS